MAKRGRKPKSESTKTYFGEQEENAVDRYIASDSAEEKNEIYNSVLKPAFVKMIESIIRRYKLYIPEEEFIDTFNDTLSFMMTKIDKFRREVYGYWLIDNWDNVKQSIRDKCSYMDESVYLEKKENACDEDPDYIVVTITPKSTMSEPIEQCFVKEIRHFKAYSYCGTISKNYLIQKIKQYHKKLVRHTSYDEMSAVLVNDIKYSEDEATTSNFAQDVMKELSLGIRNVMDTPASYENMTINEKKVGDALLILLENWEDILDDRASNKLNKSSVLYFLREETRLNTKEIRDSMKKFKSLYYLTKQDLLN